MKLTTASVNALRALAYLVRRPEGSPVASQAIAEAEGLSQGFLLKALTALARAGVLRSQRGPGGGVFLA